MRYLPDGTPGGAAYLPYQTSADSRCGPRTVRVLAFILTRLDRDWTPVLPHRQMLAEAMCETGYRSGPKQYSVESPLLAARWAAASALLATEGH